MSIRRGQLIHGTLKKATEGINGAHVCSVKADGNIVRAYVKRLPNEKLIVECFCALLLQEWGLNVPEPIIVEIDGNDWFGSLDAAYPSLYRRFFLGNKNSPGWRDRIQHAMEVATHLPDAPLALACDEAIANYDRNLGNILWDGKNTAWIDHENAIDIHRRGQNINKLVRMAVTTGNFFDIERAAINAAKSLGGADLDKVVRIIHGSDGYARLVEDRLKTLQQRIVEQFPGPDDDLFRALPKR